MLDALEIVLIVMVVGGLLLLQAKTRTGALFPYLAVVILVLILIVAMRIIRFIIGIAIVLALLCAFCGILLWRVARST